MRLPGTLKSLLAQVKASPVPIGSIAITEKGAVSLTFVEAAPAVPRPTAPAPLTERKPLRERDTASLTRTPPIVREDPWAPPVDGAA